MASESVLPELHFSRLVRAAEGLTQWRALLASILTFLLAAIIGGLGSYMAMKSGGGGGSLFMVGLTGLVEFIVFATGLSAVGVMLMDRAKMIPVRSMVDAFVYGLLCLPKFIGFALCLLALMVVAGIVAALGYFVCKIPGVGPVLLVIAHPIFVFALAAILAALAWVAIPLFAPAVWEGRSFGESLSVLHAVAKSRLFPVVTTFVMLYVFVAIVSGVVMSALFPSWLSMTSVAASVLGPDFHSPESFASVWMQVGSLFMGGGGAGNGGTGHLVAGMIATLIIFGLAGALIAQVLIMGVNLVYLIAVEGLDLAASRSAIEGGLAQVKQKAAEAQERARQAADRARATAQAAAAPPAQAAAASLNCPKCRAVVKPDDPFCSECGYKLRA